MPGPQSCRAGPYAGVYVAPVDQPALLFHDPEGCVLQRARQGVSHAGNRGLAGIIGVNGIIVGLILSGWVEQFAPAAGVAGWIVVPGHKIQRLGQGELVQIAVKTHEIGGDETGRRRPENVNCNCW